MLALDSGSKTNPESDACGSIFRALKDAARPESQSAQAALLAPRTLRYAMYVRGLHFNSCCHEPTTRTPRAAHERSTSASATSSSGNHKRASLSRPPAPCRCSPASASMLALMSPPPTVTFRSTSFAEPVDQRHDDALRRDTAATATSGADAHERNRRRRHAGDELADRHREVGRQKVGKRRVGAAAIGGPLRDRGRVVAEPGKGKRHARVSAVRIVAAGAPSSPPSIVASAAG